jgi:hypothetical protein
VEGVIPWLRRSVGHVSFVLHRGRLDDADKLVLQEEVRSKLDNEEAAEEQLQQAQQLPPATTNSKPQDANEAPLVSCDLHYSSFALAFARSSHSRTGFLFPRSFDVAALSGTQYARQVT